MYWIYLSYITYYLCFVHVCVEVISVYPSVGCDNQTVPDMLSGNGLRSLHNLAYNPETPGKSNEFITYEINSVFY